MNNVILSPITIEDFKTALSDIVRSELKSELQLLKPSPKPDDLLTRKETASLLGVSLHTLHDWTISGKVPAYRIGSRVRYKRSEIEGSLNQIKSPKKMGN